VRERKEGKGERAIEGAQGGKGGRGVEGGQGGNGATVLRERKRGIGKEYLGSACSRVRVARVERSALRRLRCTCVPH
jgi:hypothetical protein